VTTGIVAAVDRNGVDESFHHGTVVVADAAGCRALVGDIDTVIYPRSSLKPLQTTAMLEAGLCLNSRGLALASASHDGSAAHLEVVREVLAAAGRSEADLATTPDLPFDRGEAESVIAAGGGRTSLQMNCSGKHAAMIATCVAAGWPVKGHLEPDHPLQSHIAQVVARLTGEVSHIGVDGCGAPTHAVPIGGLALAISAIAAESGEVWSAMTGHPELVGGPERPVSVLMRAVPGLMAKDGAEGVFVAGLPDGRAVAVKIADGAARAAAVVAAAALRTLGVDVPVEIDAALAPPALGGGRTVGRVRATL
jgi:L-asparaginase II